MTNTKLIVLIIFIFFGCRSIEVKDYAPEKLKSIPNGAFWKGGIDGGNWFLIGNSNTHLNVVDISIYNEQDGSLITTKPFLLICDQLKQTTLEDLHNKINFFDGEKIHLVQSDKVDCYLQPKE